MSTFSLFLSDSVAHYRALVAGVSRITMRPSRGHHHKHTVVVVAGIIISARPLSRASSSAIWIIMGP